MMRHEEKKITITTKSCISMEKASEKFLYPR